MLFKKTPIFRSSCWVTLFCLVGTSITFDGRGTFLDVLSPRSRIPNQEESPLVKGIEQAAVTATEVIGQEQEATTKKKGKMSRQFFKAALTLLMIIPFLVLWLYHELLLPFVLIVPAIFLTRKQLSILEYPLDTPAHQIVALIVTLANLSVLGAIAFLLIPWLATGFKKRLLPKRLSLHWNDLVGRMNIFAWSTYWKLAKRYELSFMRDVSRDLLGLIQHPKVIPYLREWLRDKEHDVRWLARQRLGKLDPFPETQEDQVWWHIAGSEWEEILKFGTTALDPLSFILLRDSNLYSKKHAAVVLAHIEDPRVLPVLETARTESSDFSLNQMLDRLIQFAGSRRLEYAL